MVAAFLFALHVAAALPLAWASEYSTFDIFKTLLRGPLASNSQTADSPQDVLVIGAGFARTGTSSFVTALEMLGLKSYHMKHGVFETPGHSALWARHAAETTSAGKTTTTEMLLQAMRNDGFNATADFPASLLYEELMEYYPDARVVLTVRHDGGTGFAKSALKTIRRVPRIANRIPFRWMNVVKHINIINSWCHNFIGVPPNENAEQPDTRDNLAEAYDLWVQKVRSTVPKEKLLIFSAQDGWRPLCDFLSPVKDVIADRCKEILQSGIAYPRVNDAAFVQSLFACFHVVSTLFEYFPIIFLFVLVGWWLLGRWSNPTGQHQKIE